MSKYKYTVVHVYACLCLYTNAFWRLYEDQYHSIRNVSENSTSFYRFPKLVKLFRRWNQYHIGMWDVQRVTSAPVGVNDSNYNRVCKGVCACELRLCECMYVCHVYVYVCLCECVRKELCQNAQFHKYSYKVHYFCEQSRWSLDNRNVYLLRIKRIKNDALFRFC